MSTKARQNAAKQKTGAPEPKTGAPKQKTGAPEQEAGAPEQETGAPETGNRAAIYSYLQFIYSREDDRSIPSLYIRSGGLRGAPRRIRSLGALGKRPKVGSKSSSAAGAEACVSGNLNT